MFEKRVIIPTFQALAVGATAGAFALVTQSDIPAATKTALQFFLGGTGAAMVKLYFFPGTNQPPSRQPGRAYANDMPLPTLSYTPPVKAEANGARVWAGWPVTFDELRFYCSHIARGYPLGVDTWTTNKGEGDRSTKIWSKKVYGVVVGKMKLHDYVKRSGKGVTTPLCLTEIGRAWAWQVVNNPDPLPPQEFSLKLEGFLPVASKQAELQGAAGGGAL